MEAVKKAIAIPGMPWEPCIANEFKIRRNSLNHDAMVWFNFMKQCMLPTSHTTNVEKEGMMLLDATLGAKDVDVGRLISREIKIWHGRKEELSIDPFPTILKAKKPMAASGDPTMLQQFIKEEKARREFQRKKHLWLLSVLSKNLKDPTEISVPEFPRVIDEEAMDDVLFEDEPNEDVEAKEEREEVVVEKKIKRGTVKGDRKETRDEVKRGKKPVSAEDEEDDLLATDSDTKSLSEGKKQENIDVMQELRKEGEEEDPSSTKDEGEDFHDANDDLNAEPDIVPAVTELVSEPTP